MQYIFWVCAGTIVFTYAVYPLVLLATYLVVQTGRELKYLFARRDRRLRDFAAGEEPALTIIIPAYNEEARLGAKIANLSRLDYPKSKLHVIFVSDGSTDGTNSILQELKDPEIEIIFLPTRTGKPSALNEAVSRARTEILVFSDAATLFATDALRKLVRHFADPRVGVVCGALQFEGTPQSVATEGIYWKFESMLRLMEGRLGATLTASGACYAARRQCVPQLAAEALIDDLIVPMHARRERYRVVYDPEATACELAAATIDGEFIRRVRIGAGSFRALHELSLIRLPFLTLLAFLCHKVLRWIVPFLLVGLLISSAVLWSALPYSALLALQLVFYLWAAVGFLLRGRKPLRYMLMGYFLLAMNVAFLIGFVRFLRGRQTVTWERVH